jgi:hypothetical protein
VLLVLNVHGNPGPSENPEASPIGPTTNLARQQIWL